MKRFGRTVNAVRNRVASQADRALRMDDLVKRQAHHSAAIGTLNRTLHYTDKDKP
jgi:hypothetical protein